MTEFYIETNSFAAPFVSDSGHCYIEALNACEALEKCAKQYSHPCGLYAAAAYLSADARNKGEPFLARWLSNQAQRLSQSDVRMLRMDRPGVGEINGQSITIDSPKDGKVFAA
jgi:hypothetical protein